MKISNAQASRLETLRNRLASTKGNAGRLFDDLQRVIKTAENNLAAAIDLYNSAAREAEDFVKDVAQKFEDEFDDKSDKWKESEAGEAAREFIDEWLGADLDQVKAPRVLMPDAPDFGDYELALPEESNS